MTIQEKLEMLEEIMDLDSGSLSEEDELINIEEWDSISVLSFISEMKKRFSISVDVKTIKQFETIKDICLIIPD